MNDEVEALAALRPYAVFRDAIAVLGSVSSVPEDLRLLALGLVARPEPEQAMGLARAVDALPEAVWAGLSFADRQVVLVARVAAEHHASSHDAAPPSRASYATDRVRGCAWTRKLSPRGFHPAADASAGTWATGISATGVSASSWGP
ncbi:hypothetical protein [Sinomonas sp. ASV322]|uniref:hypothetical protein n=1 Tax=Sinomonas sp. ASV322 TaxID=3041920 RepID=UPI0027DD512C|nr:hypothetical protein [Sinomonas sp. ASV322]MDQ4503763.1 hypothetical protein [Sinomonas sp. ASV322]